MAVARTPSDATLLDVLIDGFERNELIDGFYWRQLPMADDGAAARKFESLTDEARRWKGPPKRMTEEGGRRLAAWPDLEIRAAGRGLVVRARMPQFADWWHDDQAWQDDAMGPVFDWIAEDREA